MSTSLSAQPARPKKHFWTRWWFWLIVGVILLAALFGPKDGDTTSTAPATSAADQVTLAAPTTQAPSNAQASSPAAEQPSADTATAPPTTDAPAPAPAPAAAAATEAAAAVPAEYNSALVKAEQYSEMMHMSKQGIYDQLTSEYGEQFSAEAAQYAIDNMNADWNANALAKAKEYQNQMSMSPEAIRDQLTSAYGEEFTQEEADYAVANLGN